MKKRTCFTGLALFAMALFTFLVVTAHVSAGGDDRAAAFGKAAGEEEAAAKAAGETEGPAEAAGEEEAAEKSEGEAEGPAEAAGEEGAAGKEAGEELPYGWIPGSRWAESRAPDEIPLSSRELERPLSDGSGTEVVTIYDRFLGWAETEDGEIYPIFDEPPLIAARDLSVTSVELLTGFDLRQALLARAEVRDREDGPEEVAVSVFSFDRTAFFSGDGIRSVTATLRAEDSAGNVSYTSFEVTRTSGRLTGMNGLGWGSMAAADYIRSIDLNSVHRQADAGGLSEKSIWRKKRDYAAALAEALFRLQEGKYLVTFQT